MNGQGARRSDLVGLAAVVLVALAPLLVVCLAGTLGGLLAHGRPLVDGLAESAHIALRLPDRLTTPRLEWPAPQRARLPGRLELEVLLAVSAVLVLVALALLIVLLARLGAHGERARAARFARRRDLGELRVTRAQTERVSLGVHHGRLIAAEPRASILLVGPSQSGKTKGLVTPALLEWDGPVISTSVKSDTVHDTHAARSRRGQVRIFDPTSASGLPGSPWSPIAASQSWEAARRTASRLLGVGQHAAARSADEAFWRPAAARFLGPLLLAAAHGDLTTREVLAWIATIKEQEPAALLQTCPDPGAGPACDALRSVWDSDPRFRSSLLQTLATALDPWQEPQVTAATVGDSQITSDWLLGGANTLYIVSPADDQRRLSGLFRALLADIAAGVFAASARSGKPIEPALLLCLDEAANIAPLPNLDELASTGPGQGLQLLTVFQDLSQAADRWGRERAETIFANHRARLFTSSIGDRATLEYLTHTLGEEEIQRTSTHRSGPLASGSRTRSSEFRALAPPNRVREQDRDTALLIYGRLAPAWIDLRQWDKDAGLRALAAAREPRARLTSRTLGVLKSTLRGAR